MRLNTHAFRILGPSCVGVLFVVAGVAVSALAPWRNVPAQTASTSTTGISIEGYQLVGQKRVAQTTSDLTYKVIVRNNSTSTITSATGTVTTTSSALTLLDDKVSFGEIDPGSTSQSADTIQVRQDRGTSFSAVDLAWGFTVNDSTYADNKSGITFEVATFSRPVIVEPQNTQDNQLNLTVYTRENNGNEVQQYRIITHPNSEALSLADWFSAHVDFSGTLIRESDVEIIDLLNGVQVLFVRGPITSAHLECCGPLQVHYAMTPSKDRVIYIITSSDHNLDVVSYDEIENAYVKMLSSMSFSR